MTLTQGTPGEGIPAHPLLVLGLILAAMIVLAVLQVRRNRQARANQEMRRPPAPRANRADRRRRAPRANGTSRRRPAPRANQDNTPA
jgi:hypothetical protein